MQTVLPVVLRRRLPIEFRPERLELPDGDFLDLAWSAQGRGKLAIITHGLEGCADADYIRGVGTALNAAGWDALAWNFRGCGAELNRLPRFYHSGETGDLGCIIEHAARQYSQIVLVGFSLGGNVTLKYLGEGQVHDAVCAGIAVSVPVDLAASARALDSRWSNRIYLKRFITTLVAKVEAKAVRFPEHFDIAGVRKIRSFAQFDDRYTAPLHGFRDAEDYWTRSSARQYLPRITVPTLLLNARNDPFLTDESFPVAEAEGNPHLFLEMPESGGHVGFLDLANGLERWSERRAVEFLKQRCGE